MLDWLTAPWQSELIARGGAVAILTAIAAAAIGCWVVLRDLPYAAESLAHGMFPGLVAAGLIGIPTAIGGLTGLIVAAVAIAAARRAGISGDPAVAVAITPLIGIGAILALAGPLAPGVGSSLFGDVLAADGTDLTLAIGLLLLTAVSLRLLHWRLLASGLRQSGAGAELALLALLAVATASSARGLGALLPVAMFVGPAAAARAVSTRASAMIAVATALAALAAFAGIELSWHANLAAGPAIAVCAIIPAAVIGLAGRAHRTTPTRDPQPTPR
jgi:ABC-type Mn2+/Zn2+ transport system permease subunit